MPLLPETTDAEALVPITQHKLTATASLGPRSATNIKNGTRNTPPPTPRIPPRTPTPTLPAITRMSSTTLTSLQQIGDAVVVGVDETLVALQHIDDAVARDVVVVGVDDTVVVIVVVDTVFQAVVVGVCLRVGSRR